MDSKGLRHHWLTRKDSRKSKRAAMHDSPYRHTHIHLPPRLPERELDSFGLVIHPNGFGLLFVEPHDKLLLFDNF